MKNRKVVKKVIFSLVALLLLGSAFLAGNYSGQAGLNLGIGPVPEEVINASQGKPTTVDFSTFWEAWNKLNQDYVATLDSQKLVYGAITGLLASSGDPYTQFLDPSENKLFKEDFSGNFDGIGIEISSVNNLPTVVAPLSGTPAEKAGIKPKDIILEVDGTKTSDIGFEETISRIRGAKGTVVKLTISRAGEDKPLEISVVRENITVASVTTETKNTSGKKLAYIKIRQFGDDTDDLFTKAVNQAKNDNVDGVILDLRNNPGGYLESAISMASDFLDNGIVVSEVGRDGKQKDSSVSRKAVLPDTKIVVLINSGSASASEIVAGALKDRNRAIIIGEKSFGKGSVQVMENLSDNSAVKITIAKWLTPNGTHIDKVGIAPNIEVKDDDTTANDEQLDRAMEEIVK